MPDLNLGTVYTQLDIDTSALNQRVDEVMQAWESIKSGSSRAAVGLSETMVYGVDQYQKKLTIIEQKLERQRQLIQQLEQTSRKTPVGRNSYREITRATEQLEKEKLKLQELEAQFDRTYDAQRNFIVQQDKTAKKVQETAQKMDMRKAGANMKIGTDLAASGLRTLDQVAPGVAGNIGNIITQINTARTAMEGMSITPMKWAMGISAAVGVVTTLVMAGIKQMQEAEEERQRAFEEGMEKSKEYAQNLIVLESNIRILKDEKSTVDQVKAARAALTNTFPELIAGYTEEGEAILNNIKNLDEYTERLKIKQELSRRDIVKNGGDDLAKSKDLKNQINSLLEQIDKEQEVYRKAVDAGGVWMEVIPGGMVSGQGREAAHYAERSLSLISSLEDKLDDLQLQYRDSIPDVSEFFKAQLEGAVKVADANGDLTLGWQDMDKTQQMALNAFVQNTENLERYILGGDDALKEMTKELQNLINNPELLSTYIAQFQKATAAAEKQAYLEDVLADSYRAQEAPVSALTDAYKQLSKGHLLSKDSMRQLAQTFPEIHEYLEKTKDITLDNGRIITEVMGKLDFSEEINALGSLSKAYESLKNGQQLSVSQLYEMAQQYPQIADYINQTSDATLDHGEVVRQLYELERQEMVLKAESARQAKILQAEETQSLITQLEERLSALQIFYRSAGTAAGFELKATLDATSADLEKARQEYEKQQENIKNAETSLKLMKSSASGIGSIGGSGKKSSGASRRNEALAAELKQLEQKKKMDQLTSAQELEWLQRIQKKYKLSAEEKMDLEYRVYSAKKKLEQEAEQAATQRLQAEYKAIENRKNLGELSAKEELAWLQKIQRTFQMNKDEQMELEIKLYNLKKQLRQEDVDALNTLGAAVTEALKNKYKEQQEAEQQRINDSIQSWKDWEEETVKAIQGQIDALDQLEKQQEEEEKRAEYEKKRQATALQLAYEKDDYNRKQLEKELARLDAEEKKRREAADRQAQKDELQKEIDKIKETSSAQQDALQKELETLDKQYAELTKDFNLRAEAEKAIMESTQKEILEMIKSYAPEYDLAGQSIGEKLADGFKKKVGDIAAYMENMVGRITDYQKKLAATANAAADDFWKSRAEYEKKMAALSAGAAADRLWENKVKHELYAADSPLGPGRQAACVNMTVNFNRPVESPIEMKRQMDRVAADLARRIGG